jgi:isoquinoline 1-oxidoreductase beta subunit
MAQNRVRIWNGKCSGRILPPLRYPKYGDQDTDGSKSIRDFYDTLRQAGTTGRLMLERAAAAK